MAPFPHVELYGAHAPVVEENGVGGLTRQEARAAGQGAANGVSPAPSTPAARPLRADAARNRAKVLEAANEAFAAEGPGVALDEIARRAGVGAGTVYRHFPTKEALLQAVVSDRLHSLAAEAEARLAAPGTDPGEAFFGYFIEIIESGLEKADLTEALTAAGAGVGAETLAAGARLMAGLGTLLHRAQQAGNVRTDVSADDLHALAAAAIAAEKRAAAGPDPAPGGRMTRVICDGLRPRGADSGDSHAFRAHG
jgi:AcrR family transcriptional regulator